MDTNNCRRRLRDNSACSACVRRGATTASSRVQNVVASLTTEASAKRLSKTVAQQLTRDVRVVRGGVELLLASESVVPGDIVCLAANDIIPADVRWIETSHLSVSETILTGRVDAVVKDSLPCGREEPLARRHNLGYCGTHVRSGEGRAVVIQTGLRTELGRVTQGKHAAPSSIAPLPQQLRVMGMRLCVTCTVVSVVSLLVAKYAWHAETDHAFASAVAVAVAMVPEVLPLAITMVLRMGESVLRQHHAIITKLEDVETVGTISAICFDKTGTLTQNMMLASQVVVSNGTYSVGGQGYRPVGSVTFSGGVAAASSAVLQTLLRGCISMPPTRVRVYAGGSLASDSKRMGASRAAAFAHISNKHLVAQLQWKADGDPTDAALMVLGLKLHACQPEHLDARCTILADVPDVASGTYATVAVHHTTQDADEPVRIPPSSTTVKHIRGALDAVLPLCVQQRSAATDPPSLQQLDASHWQREHDRMCALGLRVIAVAECELSEPNAPATSFAMCALVGISDIPRTGLPGMFAACKEAGVHCIMVTGDDAGTAAALAADVRMPVARVTTGAELRELPVQDVVKRIMMCSIVARASAEDKAFVVDAMQQAGHRVAMVGDGVNDVPAMRQADMSIAIKGAATVELPPQTARMEVFAHRLSGLERVIADARHTYACMQRIILFMLSTSSAQCCILSYAMLADVPQPLAHLQILYHNIFVGLTVTATLATPNVPSGVHRGRPRLSDQPIVSRWHVARLCITTGLWAALTYVQDGLAHDVLHATHEEQLTISFVTFLLTQLAVALSCCCDKHGWVIDWPRAAGCIAANAVTLVFVMYVPGVNEGMELTPISGKAWALCFWVPVAVSMCAHMLEYMRWRAHAWLLFVSRRHKLRKLSGKSSHMRRVARGVNTQPAFYADDHVDAFTTVSTAAVNPAALVRSNSARRASVRFIGSVSPAPAPRVATPPVERNMAASRRDLAAVAQRSTRAVLARPLQAFVVPVLPLSAPSRASVPSQGRSTRRMQASVRRLSTTATGRVAVGGVPAA